MGGLGEPGGHPAPHSPAPDVVNEGELRLDGKGEQSHLRAWGGGQTWTTPPPPPAGTVGGSDLAPHRQESQENPSPTHSAGVHVFLLLAFLPGVQHLRAQGWVSPGMGCPPSPLPWPPTLPRTL